MRRLLHAVLGAVVVAAALTVSATPALANTCSTAYAMGTPGAAEMDTQTRTGAVASYNPEEWYEHSTNVAGRLVVLTALDGADTLEVYGAGCPLTPFCTGSATSLGPAQCPVPQTGLVKIRVKYDPSGGAGSNYSLTAQGATAAECSDGVDNDGDGWTDAVDPHCTGPFDNTESQVHLAAYGHITLETNAGNLPKMTLSGVYADASSFTCEIQYSPKIQVSCVEKFDPEVAYDCASFILTAKAFSTSAPTGPGTVKGHLTCDEPSVLETAEVSNGGSSVVTNHSPNVYLGTAGVVRCRAAGINGAVNATGAYTVDCYEPGVAWPFETVPKPVG
ncbi:MAG TPA: hypothetical protein VFQ85_12755 [Mycobacteriales bacterium]|jgi:hypothetical protein|nr:hypothetical protein [Mycobacteriales bacterium]